MHASSAVQASPYRRWVSEADGGPVGFSLQMCGRIIRMGATLGIVFGVVLMLLGVILLRDYRTMGTQIVGKTIPNSLRTGDPDRYRKVLGSCYLLGGIVFAAVGIVVLAR